MIASCVEYTAQSFSSIGASSEPSTLTPLQFPHSSFSGQSHKNTAVNFTRFVELLASISDDHNINTTTPSNNNNTVLSGGCTILPLLLGTTENSSNTISNLLHQRVTPSSSSNNAASVQQQQQQQHQLPGLPIHLMLPPSHAIDMTLVLVVCMANAVAAVSSSTRTAAGTEGNVSLAYIQTAIKSVLSQWFTEHFRDKITADPFVHGVVEYLRAQYSLHISGNSTYIPRNRLALPVELRKPSLSLLTHIIQSAQAALRYVRVCVCVGVTID
ncbi:unnamed protein product [Trichobilharzia regenti]|nr:unnamed protein product [Trichobilharzia regenti]